MKTHGQSIQSLPMLLPGSVFAITESGFDTGQREFVVDRSAIPNVLPALDAVDTSISYVDGSGVIRKGNYASMYVSAISPITEMRMNQVKYTVSYLGLVKPNKRVKLRQGTVTNLSEDTFLVRGAGGAISSKTGPSLESLPSVTRIYVANKQPDMSGYGRLAVPPELIGLTAKIKGGPFEPSMPLLYSGWMLSNRETRQCGPLHEVTDVHNWIHVKGSNLEST